MDLETKQQILNVLDSTLRVEELVYAHFQELGNDYALTIKAHNPDDDTDYQTFYFKQTEYGYVLDIRKLSCTYFAVDIKDEDEILTIAMRIKEAYVLSKYLEVSEHRLKQPELNRLQVLKDPVMFTHDPNRPITRDHVVELSKYPHFGNLINDKYLDSYLMAVNINELNRKHIADYTKYGLVREVLSSVLVDDVGVHNFTSSIKYLGHRNDIERTHIYTIAEYEPNGQRRDTVAYIRVPELLEDEDGGISFNEGRKFEVEFGRLVHLKSDSGKLLKVRDQYVRGCRSATGVRGMSIYKEGKEICPTS